MIFNPWQSSWRMNIQNISILFPEAQGVSPRHENVGSADPPIVRVGRGKSRVHIMQGFLLISEHISVRGMQLMVMLLRLLVKVTKMWVRIGVEMRMKFHSLLWGEVVWRGEVGRLEIRRRRVRQAGCGRERPCRGYAADQLSQSSMTA